jgi:hypothetical protein
VTTAGEISTSLAGVYEQGLDFDSDYDLGISHPAAEVEFPVRGSFLFSSGATSYLGIDGSGNLYVTALIDDAYVEKLTCSP